MEFPKPSFSLETNIEEQQGFFYSVVELPSAIKPVMEAVGRVRFEGEDVGSCFIVDNRNRRFLLSALHCFQEEDNEKWVKEVIFPSGETVIVGSEDMIQTPELQSKDIFVARLDAGIRVNPLRLSEKGVGKTFNTIGDVVVALGYPSRYLHAQAYDGPVASIGRVLDYRGVEEGIHVEVDIRIEPGNSGGPIIDKTGEVVGILTKELTQPLSTPKDTLEAFIDRTGDYGRLRRISAGYVAWAIPVYYLNQSSMI